MQSHERFMFREFALLLYSINYLLSPALVYQLDSASIANGMKIDSMNYFSLALPGFVLLALGLFIIPTRIFQPVFSDINRTAVVDERFFVVITIFGFLCKLTAGIFPG